MKDKKYLLYERSLLTCILMLFICIGLKLFGVPWFDLNTDVPILNEIDKIVMNSYVLSFLYSLLFRCINTYLVVIIVTKSLKINVVKFVLGVTASMVIAKATNASYISFIADTLIPLAVCVDLDRRKITVIEYIITFIMNILYQSISLYIKDLGIQLSYYGLTISLLFMIDYYIMLVITYLYLKKGDKTLCGIFRHCGSYLADKLSKMLLNASKRLSESRGGK